MTAVGRPSGRPVDPPSERADLAAQVRDQERTRAALVDYALLRRLVAPARPLPDDRALESAALSAWASFASSVARSGGCLVAPIRHATPVGPAAGTDVRAVVAVAGLSGG
jgi:hypothetical protein